MVEEEDEGSHTRINIIASPELGAINENELISTVLSELGKGKDGLRMMARIWSDTGAIRVKRERPHITPAGKLLPLHIHKRE